MQRRFGLHISAAAPIFAGFSARGDPYDPFCDRLLSESGTDRSAPHTDALAQIYAAHEATAPSTVVLGDKANADHYRLYNATHCLDIGERGQAPGGRDFLGELKVWQPLHPAHTAAPTGTIRRGATHACGNTLEHATRTVLGVQAREGARAWDHAVGKGKVREHQGQYHDALHVKRNMVALILLETFGGFSRPAVKHLRWLKARAARRDLTEYESWRAKGFMVYWTQRISAAVVTGDARRALNALAAKATELAAAPG